MARYFYSKYQVLGEFIEPSWSSSSAANMKMEGLSKSYVFDKKTGRFLPSGGYWQANERVYDNNIGYKILSDGLQIEMYSVPFGSSPTLTASDFNVYNLRSKIRDSNDPRTPGTLITTLEAEDGAYPNNGVHTDGFWYIKGEATNQIPVINLATVDGRTFYENETFLIEGTVIDANIGNIVNVKYRINNEPIKAIETKISKGVNIPFNKVLTLNSSRLLDGTTPVTNVLEDSSQHVLKVWAEDDQGGKSPEQIRTFYVVANRAPVINVDNIADQSGMVNADTIRITGRANDPDNNEITAKYRINTGALIDLPLNNGEWIVTLPIKQLVDGNNNITIEVTDSYNFKSTKTIRLRKDFRATELPESVQRYKIEPPRGSAKGILLWVQREESQTVEASISMVDTGSQESYTPMNLSVTAPVGNGMVEDEFIYEADTARASIHLKLNITGSGSVALISGVLT